MRPCCPAPALALVLLAAACGGGDDKPGAEAGAAGGSDSGTAPASCAPPAWELAGCLVQTFDDHDADGRFPEVGSELYDAEGRLVGWDQRSPTEWDSYSACWRVYTGALLVEEVCVGQPAYRTTWAHDDAGHPVSRSYDAGDDGNVDKVWSYTTDSAGHIIAEEIDEDLDGSPDARADFTVDDAGNRTSEQWDYDLDGDLDFTSVSTWEDGRKIREERDTDGDLVTDALLEWDYDAWGQPLESREDDNNDGTSEETTTWSYEDCAPTGHITLDASGRRTVVSLEVDALRRIVRERTDYDGDGTADQDRRIRWSCPGG